MWEKIIAANKAVQESGIFKTAKELFVEDGLRTNARESALSSMEKNASDQYIDSLKFLKESGDTSGYNGLKKAREQYANIRDKSDMSAAAYKGMSDVDQKRLASQASVKSALKNNEPEGNTDIIMKKYQKALRASKAELNARTGFDMAKDYFANPFADGRYGTGTARAAAGIGGIGAITYSLTGNSSDYSANYSSSNGGGDTQDF